MEPQVVQDYVFSSARRPAQAVGAVRRQGGSDPDPQHGHASARPARSGRTASTVSTRTSSTAPPSSSPVRIRRRCSRNSPSRASGASRWSATKARALPPIWVIGLRRRPAGSPASRCSAARRRASSCAVDNAGFQPVRRFLRRLAPVRPAARRRRADWTPKFKYRLKAHQRLCSPL